MSACVYATMSSWLLLSLAATLSIISKRLGCFLDFDGIEVAARPILYPYAAFGDSDVRRRLLGQHLGRSQLPSLKRGFLRKCLSLRTAYATDVLLIFLLYDIYMARIIISMLTLAEKRGLPPETLADNTQYSDAYWAHEQDYLADAARQMSARVRQCRSALSESEVAAAREFYGGHLSDYVAAHGLQAD